MQIDKKLLLENSKHLHVLYVEDDNELRDSTVKLFDNFFKSVVTASDGVLGYEKYKARIDEGEEPYDIVITDINMPNMNGIDMCKKIKSLNDTQAIIIVTAFNEVEYLNSAIELGVNGFLSKPIEMQSVMGVFYTVTQLVANRKLEKEHYEQIEALNMLYIDKKDASGFASSKDILDDLENNKEKISKLWTAHDIVHERLGSHMIDVEFFRKHYALKVIEYFLSVIKGDNKAGNCPVVFVMLDFFKNKDLPLKDIFMICVLFKNTVSSYIFSKYSFNQKLFDDISSILDKNFEGVISNYLEMNYTMIIHKPVEKKQEDVAVKHIQEEDVEEITYREYVLENDIYELEDLEEDIDSLAVSVTESTQAVLGDFINLGNLILRYGSILSNYPIFTELGAYVVKLGANFTKNAQLLFDDRAKMMNIAALMEGFVNDLIVWRREVFDNNVKDPHFLNQSFFSNVDTIIMFIEYDESAVAEEDDFDDMFF